MKIAYSILKRELAKEIAEYKWSKVVYTHCVPDTAPYVAFCFRINQHKATIHSLKQAMKLIRKHNENRKR